MLDTNLQNAFNKFCKEEIKIHYIDLTNIAMDTNEVEFIKYYFIAKLKPMLIKSKPILKIERKPKRKTNLSIKYV